MGRYPEDTLRQTWFGEKAELLRQYIRKNDLSGGCSACEEVILSGNYQGTKAIYYDEYARPHDLLSRIREKLGIHRVNYYPRVFEFELSNSCNLECTMCNGYFSSAIRKNREHLPPFRNHYDNKFVEEVKEFIPHLTDAKFLGGEPFLIEIYYKIWDEVIRLNKDMLLHITTNGTILNPKVKKYLEQMRAGIVVSIDSLDKGRYEKIRVNASYDEVIENIAWFRDYTRRKGTYLSFAVCPIRSNWQDMPGMVRYCNEHDIAIHFNTVWTPETESLRYLEMAELEVVVGRYRQAQFDASDPLQQRNLKNFRDYTSQLEYWLEEKMQENSHVANWAHVFDLILPEELNTLSRLARQILAAEKAYYATLAIPEGLTTPDLSMAGVAGSRQADLQEQMRSLYTSGTEGEFLQAYFDSLCFFAEKALPPAEADDLKFRIGQLAAAGAAVARKDELASELIRTGFLFHFNLFREQQVEELITLLRSRFG